MQALVNRFIRKSQSCDFVKSLQYDGAYLPNFQKPYSEWQCSCMEDTMSFICRNVILITLTIAENQVCSSSKLIYFSPKKDIKRQKSVPITAANWPPKTVCQVLQPHG